MGMKKNTMGRWTHLNVVILKMFMNISQIMPGNTWKYPNHWWKYKTTLLFSMLDGVLLALKSLELFPLDNFGLNIASVVKLVWAKYLMSLLFTGHDEGRAHEGVDGVRVLWLALGQEFRRQTTDHGGYTLDQGSVNNGHLKEGRKKESFLISLCCWSSCWGSGLELMASVILTCRSVLHLSKAAECGLPIWVSASSRPHRIWVYLQGWHVTLTSLRELQDGQTDTYCSTFFWSATAACVGTEMEQGCQMVFHLHSSVYWLLRGRHKRTRNPTFGNMVLFNKCRQQRTTWPSH